MNELIQMNKYQTLEEIAEVARAKRKAKMSQYKPGREIHRITVNGMPAVQFDHQGITSGSDEPVLLIHTIVEADMQLYELMTWTTLDKLKENRPKLDAVIAKFEEIPSVDKW